MGQPLKLAKFMKDDLRAIYDNPAGTRRAIITRGRKNAKSTECAIILLLHMVGPEHKINGQCFSIAQSRDQAAIIFNLARGWSDVAGDAGGGDDPADGEGAGVRGAGHQLQGAVGGDRDGVRVVARADDCR